MSIKKNVLTLVAVAAIIAAGVFVRDHIYASAPAGKGALEGSWAVRITPNSQTPPFDELMTFGSGGEIVESNNFPFASLGLAAGPGHGVSEYLGHQKFNFTFTKFLFNQGGLPAGTLRVTGRVDYSSADDTWTSPATVEIFDPAGNLVLTDTTAGAARRVRVEK